MSETTSDRRLRFFGHVCHADTPQDITMCFQPALMVFIWNGGKDLEFQNKPGCEMWTVMLDWCHQRYEHRMGRFGGTL